MKFVPLNLALMSHPANWLVVTLMVLLSGFMLAAGMSFINQGAVTTT